LKLDETIGGISNKGIVEISGEAGSGKTQLCLSMTLDVCMLLYSSKFPLLEYQFIAGYSLYKRKENQRISSHFVLWGRIISCQAIITICATL